MTAVRALIDLFRVCLRWMLAAGLLVVAASAAAQWQVRAVTGATFIGSPVVASRNGQGVIYAPRYGGISGGLAWSGDLGRTWTAQPFVRSDGSEIAPASTVVYDIKVAPQSSATLYAFLSRTESWAGPTCRLIKSADGGITWSTLVDNLGACLLVLDPSDPLRLFAIDIGLENWYPPSQSFDGGVTWRSYVTGSMGAGAPSTRAAFAGDGQLYVATYIGLFVSDGRGGSWQQIMTGEVWDVVAEPWSSAPAVFVSIPDAVYVVRNHVATPLAFPGVPVTLSLVPDFATHTSALFVGYRAGLARNQPPSTVMTPFSNGIGDNARDFYRGISRVDSAAYGAAWIAYAHGGLAVCQADCEGGRLPATVEVIEFHNGDLNHYFLTANLEEAQQIDAGAAGPGWTRTHRSFKAYQGIAGSPSSSAVGIVCRFYGTPGRGPNSHFYTAFASECAGVQQDAGWRLEDPEAFAILIPKAESPCYIPVYRAYNNRAAFNDSNHRYMTERSDYDAMVAAGWIGEGTVFCTFQ